jgi:histone H3/H4
MVTIGETGEVVADKPTTGGKTIALPRRRKQATPKRLSVTKAEKEIKKQQSSVVHIIPRKTFKNLVRSIMQKQGATDMRIYKSAVEGLQDTAEAYLVEIYSEADKLREMCKSKTMDVNHMHNAIRRTAQ